MEVAGGEISFPVIICTRQWPTRIALFRATSISYKCLYLNSNKHFLGAHVSCSQVAAYNFRTEHDRLVDILVLQGSQSVSNLQVSERYHTVVLESIRDAMIMKLRDLFRKKVKSQIFARDVNPYADFLSLSPLSRPAHRSSSPSRMPAIVHRNELMMKPPMAVVDELFEMEHHQLIEAFRIIDKNRDGKISKQELGAMWKVLGENVTDEELNFMVQEVDVNGDGEIELEEFVILNKNVGLGFDDHVERAEDIKLAFNVADVDRNGHISAADLHKLMNRLSNGKEKVTMHDCIAMVRWVDSDGDNEINFTEFERVMRSTLFSSKR